MTLQFYAQPYDIDATGFYFHTHDEYLKAINNHTNQDGQQVEEYEIQLIEAEQIDYALSEAYGLNQANLAEFIEKAETWDDHDKLQFIIAVGECGYDHDHNADVTIYHESTMRELAISFIDEGLFGDIPQALEHYIDYDAIAHDLSMDYTEATIAGQQLIYRCD